MTTETKAPTRGDVWAVWSEEGGYVGNNKQWISVTPDPDVARRCAETLGDSEAVRIGVDPLRTALLEAEVARLNADLGRLMAENMARCTRLRVELEAVAEQRDPLREMARRAVHEADDLRDAVDCLGRIGDMVGFGQANWGKDDRARLVREVRDALAMKDGPLAPSDPSEPPDEVIYTLAERHPDGTHHANGSGPNGEPCIAAFGEYEDAARLADSRSSVVAWVRAERLREAERRAEALDWFAMVCRFSVAVDAARYPVPVVPPAGVRALRATLMAEELAETVEALGDGDLPGLADGLADLIYVAIGTAVAAGIDLRPVMEAVQAANLTKATGPVRADGKRGKPEGFSPPDVAGILAAQKPIPELGGQL